MATNSPPQLVVLLGAGASAKAGVPTTTQFVDRFRDTLRRKPNLRRAYQRLHQRLTLAAESSVPAKLVDVEAVLEALETLRNPTVVDRAIASDRIFGPSSESKKLDLLRKQLQEFIRTRCLVGPELTEYLLPLIQLSNAFRPLPVFTVNYDVVVEQFLDSHGLTYVDGFELRFDPELFVKPETDVFLYKLHGSVTWFKSQTGGYLKLPIRSSLRQIELLSGERAEPVMLYPAQKADYAGPFLELFRRLQETLRRCEWLLVLGYSFRDPILLDLVLDAAVSNPQLKVILMCGRRTEAVFTASLGPKVATVRESRSQRGAVIHDRIIRLPYRVEDALPDFLTMIFPALQRATTAHRTAIWAELHGEPAQWSAAAEEYLRAGVIAQGASVLSQHVTLDPLQQDQILRFSGLLALAFYASGDVAAGAKWWKDMVGELDLWLVKRIWPLVSLNPPRVTFYANWHRFPAGNEGGLGYADVATRIAEITKVGDMVLRCLGGASPSELLSPKLKHLVGLAQYIGSQPQQGFDLAAYIKDHAGHTPRWLRPLARALTSPGVDFSKEEERISKLRMGLATTELRRNDAMIRRL